MKINDILKKIDFPEKARVDRKIFKTVFYNNAEFSKKRMDIFTSEIEDIRWLFALKKENINIVPFKNEDIDYSEIQVIGVSLRGDKYLDRVAEIIHKTIQYPVVLIFEYEDRIALSVGLKRINKADASKNVVDDIYNSEWINGDIAKERDFIKSLEISNLSFANFYEFYKDFADRVRLFVACVYRDDYRYESSKKTKVIFNLYLRIKEMEEKELSLKKQIKSDISFSEKLGLNVAIKESEKKKEEYIERINA